MTVALYVVMLISVGADGGPDGWLTEVTVPHHTCHVMPDGLTLYAQIR